MAVDCTVNNKRQYWREHITDKASDNGTNGSCTATGCDENRTRSAAGGILIGAGAALAIGGTYVALVRSRGNDPVTGVAVAFRW